jgi:hypothetical protein
MSERRGTKRTVAEMEGCNPQEPPKATWENVPEDFIIAVCKHLPCSSITQLWLAMDNRLYSDDMFQQMLDISAPRGKLPSLGGKRIDTFSSQCGLLISENNQPAVIDKSIDRFVQYLYFDGGCLFRSPFGCTDHERKGGRNYKKAAIYYVVERPDTLYGYVDEHGEGISRITRGDRKGDAPEDCYSDVEVELVHCHSRANPIINDGVGDAWTNAIRKFRIEMSASQNSPSL